MTGAAHLVWPTHPLHSYPKKMSDWGPIVADYKRGVKGYFQLYVPENVR